MKTEIRRRKPCKYCQDFCGGNCEGAREARRFVEKEIMREREDAEIEDRYGFGKKFRAMSKHEYDDMVDKLSG